MSKILVIEDELAVRENIAEILDAEEYDVITAENGLVGFLQAIKHAPDLIISDVSMPQLDGHDLLKTLRMNPRLKFMPFIFLTARAESSDFLLGKSLGANFYLTKPFSQQELLKAIKASLP